jgi:hypothetical protein
MGLICESCSTPLPPEQHWKTQCTRCWATAKRSLPAKKPAEPAPAADLKSELRDRLNEVTPHRPAPFGSVRELVEFLMSSEARAASAEQHVMRLEHRIADLEAEIQRLKLAAEF